MSLSAIILYVIAYLFGSINSAIIICKIMNLPSPRSIGSGNPGATNVMRLGGRFPAALTLFFDLIKGLFIVLIARYLHESSAVLTLVGLFGVIGHIFPVFFKFKGGKGVATMIGALLGALPWIGLTFIWVWLLMLAAFRISSLSALTAVVVSYIVTAFVEPWQVSTVILAMSVIVIARHRDNIKRLIQGTEKKRA